MKIGINPDARAIRELMAAMTMSTLHVTFSPSAAEVLKEAVDDSARNDRVVCCFDNLSLGPINPVDPQIRLKWFEQEFACRDGCDFANDEAFWRDALNENIRKVAWLSRRSAPEYAGFLEWLWRLGKLPCEVVDLTDMAIVVDARDRRPATRRALSLSLVSAKEIIDNTLFDRSECIGPMARDQYHAIWQHLRAENAPLRVVNSDAIVSAPITFFDPLILSCATSTWQKAARVVGQVLGKWSEDALFQAGDGILIVRIIALIELGALEGRGNLMDIRQSEVRLANSRPGE